MVLKKGRSKVPFSPTACHLGRDRHVRTDIFVPTLAGLLPDLPVKPGDTWRVSEAAVAELTDIEKLERGGADRQVRGGREIRRPAGGPHHLVRETGRHQRRRSQPAKAHRHAVLRSQGAFISYLSIIGEHFLLDKDRRVNGKMTGEFVMVRSLDTRAASINAAALAKLTLEPNADNTLLLFEQRELGVRVSILAIGTSAGWHAGKSRSTTPTAAAC